MQISGVIDLTPDVVAQHHEPGTARHAVDGAHYGTVAERSERRIFLRHEVLTQVVGGGALQRDAAWPLTGGEGVILISQWVSERFCLA